MKELGRKNLWYSLLLAAVMMLLLIGYFIWMLPSLYVSYTEEQNLEAIKSQHQAFLDTGTYDQVHVKNPTACMSVKIPFEGAYIEAASKMIAVKIQAADAETETLLHDFCTLVHDMQNELSGKQAVDAQMRDELARMAKRAEHIFAQKVQLPVQIKTLYTRTQEGMYDKESFRMHAGPDNGIIIQSAVFDQSNQYTNYLAVSRVSDGIVFSVLPVITPQMEEIRPIVMQSVPMLCAVLLMLVLLFSQLYSNGIVHPVYQKLQDLNQSLLEENERQEMFLRATSHQLKTPVTAALLLLDGMIGQIGKYKDYEKYLPKVKEQLLSMRRIIEEILSLNKNRSSSKKCQIHLYEAAGALAESYRVAAADKQLELKVEGDKKTYIWADEAMFIKIIDNLLSNAIAYTPQREKILISISGQTMIIRNEGVTIPQELLPHIFEPFVCGKHQTSSHGLGLYIAMYYAKLMYAQLRIQNEGNGVEAVLTFHSE